MEAHIHAFICIIIVNFQMMFPFLLGPRRGILDSYKMRLLKAFGYQSVVLQRLHLPEYVSLT